MSPIGIWPVVIIVVASGLKRRPAIPDISEEGASAACSVRPGKEGPRGWIILVWLEGGGVAAAPAEPAEPAEPAVERAAVDVVVVVVVAGKVIAAFISVLPADALMLFIGTCALLRPVAISVRATAPENPIVFRIPSGYV
jgi:hypothetical protein